MSFEAAQEIARYCQGTWGRALIVGGWVRDLVRMGPGSASKDVDVEVYGVTPADTEKMLWHLFGADSVDSVGRSFGVFRVSRHRGNSISMDVSLPRRDSKTGDGHKGFMASVDPLMTIEEAARRRDFTMNAMALDPLTMELIDPFDGRKDVASGVLKIVDPVAFREDPLRVYRAAQFMSRFRLDETRTLMNQLADMSDTLTQLPGERIYEEWRKLLLGAEPSRGIDMLLACDAMGKMHPEIAALHGCPQDREWHPEGNAFRHTGMALDVAARFRTGDSDHDLALMFGVLCHDLGKPLTTTHDPDGHIRSRGHEQAGEEPTRAFLGRIKAPLDLVEKVVVLVKNHLAPAHFAAGRHQSSDGAYRRLARKLGAVGLSIRDLWFVSRADHFGRTTEDACRLLFPAGDEFLRRSEAIKITEKPEPDVVMGRHLIARGMEPGRSFGEILTKCREYQYETGEKDPDVILANVLGSSAPVA